MSLNIWTPDQGSAGLIIIPKPTPILLVTGGRIQSWTPGTVQPASSSNPHQNHDVQRTSGGILIVKQRRSSPKRIIGHPELASGATVRKDDTLYVSISEAIYRQQKGEDVELHFTPTPEDENALAYTKEQVWKQWESDKLPDGWTRARSHQPQTSKERIEAQPYQSDTSSQDSDLTVALDRLRQLRDR